LKARATIRDHLHRRRHTALLIAIIAAFAVRPLIGDSDVAIALFIVALLVLMFVALYAVEIEDLVGEREALLAQRKRLRVIGFVLAVPAIVEQLIVSFVPTPRLYMLGVISWLVFFGFITWVELRSVLKQKEVTSKTIAMAVSVYLLLGLCWGLVYILIFQMNPQAFNFGAASDATANLLYKEQHLFPVLIYFSLTTLATIGYGDITPVTLQARYAAVAEGITGQFYLAILVARLVGIYVSRSVSQVTSEEPHTSQAR
jgi:amino acid transporter